MGSASGRDANGTHFEAMEVSYREDGLHVSVGGAVLVRSMRIHGWAPSAHWRFSLAASNGGRMGAHHIRALWLSTGAAVYRAAVPLELSLNGQQFSDGDFPFVYREWAFQILTGLTGAGHGFGDGSGDVQGGGLVVHEHMSR
eukprot:305194-Prymnesium_polylepis.1